MYIENGWLSLDPIYLSLLQSHKFSDNFSDVRAQGVLRYHLIKVPWIRPDLKYLYSEKKVLKGELHLFKPQASERINILIRILNSHDLDQDSFTCSDLVKACDLFQQGQTVLPSQVIDRQNHK